MELVIPMTAEPHDAALGDLALHRRYDRLLADAADRLSVDGILVALRREVAAAAVLVRLDPAADREVVECLITALAAVDDALTAAGTDLSEPPC